MHIELLWLIPVLSFAGVLFFIAQYVQRRSEARSKQGGDLSREVALFNAGHSISLIPPGADKQEERLRELEKAINVITASLSSRQLPGADLPGGAETGEVQELKEKLRTVFKEYDVLISENYSLRAKVKQLMKLSGTKGEQADPLTPMDSYLTSNSPAAKPALQLYGDTRIMKAVDYESEKEGPEQRGSGTSR